MGSIGAQFRTPPEKPVPLQAFKEKFKFNEYVAETQSQRTTSTSISSTSISRGSSTPTDEK